MSRSASRALSRMSGPGFGGMGQFGGAFLLINALSGKIYELIAEATQVVTRGYDTGGIVGLAQSRELRVLLRRYLWLLSLVFAYEKLRWLWSFVNGFGALTRLFYIDATLRSGDQAYEWMLAYWEHSSAFRKKARDFIIETGSKSSKRRAREAMSYGGGESIYLDTLPTKAEAEAEMQTRITPKDEAEQWFIENGTLFRLRRRQQNTAPNYMMGVDGYTTPVLTIRCYSFTRKPLFKLLKKAKAVYTRTRPPLITIRVLDMRGTWRKVAYKARRPLSSIIMDDDKRQALLNDAKEFLKSEDWYAARGLRWNRGYLLHGAPGTGKSSTIQALASEIKLDVYIISINSPTMNDSVLTAAMRSIPPKSIVCIEDVDAIFSAQKRDLKDGVNAVPARMPGMYPSGAMMRMGMPGGSGGNISLSAALNAIDGVESAEGRLLVMSTNLELGELDAALTRPGRVDLYIHYKRATKAQAEQLFNIFYQPTSVDETEIEGLDEAGEAASSEPQSPVLVEKALSFVKVSEKGSSSDSTSKANKGKAGTHHPFELPSHVTQAKIAEWAKLWAEGIEDEMYTIAELQGMLLLYKKDPEAAMKDMPAWIEKEAARKEAEAEKERLREEEMRLKAEAAALAPPVPSLAASAVSGEKVKKGGRKSKASEAAPAALEDKKAEEKTTDTEAEEKAKDADEKVEEAKAPKPTEGRTLPAIDPNLARMQALLASYAIEDSLDTDGSDP